jgi:hypothetical protein
MQASAEVYLRVRLLFDESQGAEPFLVHAGES